MNIDQIHLHLDQIEDDAAAIRALLDEEPDPPIEPPEPPDPPTEPFWTSLPRAVGGERMPCLWKPYSESRDGVAMFGIPGNSPLHPSMPRFDPPFIILDAEGGQVGTMQYTGPANGMHQFYSTVRTDDLPHQVAVYWDGTGSRSYLSIIPDVRERHNPPRCVYFDPQDAPDPDPPTLPPSTGTVIHAGPALMMSGGNAPPGAWGYPSPLLIVKPSGNPRGRNTLVQCNPVDHGTNMDPGYNAGLARTNGCLGVYVDAESGHSGNGFDPDWLRAMRSACDSNGVLMAAGPKLFGAHYRDGRTGRVYSDQEYVDLMQSVCSILIEWDYNRTHATRSAIVKWYNRIRSLGFSGQYIPMVLHPKSELDPQPWLTEAEGHALIRDLWWDSELYIGHFYPQYETARTERWARTCVETYPQGPFV